MMKTKQQAEVVPAQSGQHTPGPWHITPNGGISGAGEVIVLNRKTRERGYDCHTINNGFGRATANARLIAAAPELLTALKALAMQTEGVIAKALKEDKTLVQGDYVPLRKARAAIAKAEGRLP